MFGFRAAMKNRIFRRDSFNGILKMLRSDDLQVFVLTAELGSLSAAARQLELSPAVASAALKRLEAQLGCRLLVRSTRSLRLTGEGELYLPHARSALQSLVEGQQLLAGGKATISGTLQLSAPSDFGRNVLLPWLDEFQLQHPLLSLRLLLADRNADLFRQPVDIALRYGQPEDSSLVAVPVAAANRRVLCASPGYLAANGSPRTLADLADHNCLRFMLAGRVHERWCFLDDRRRELEQLVSGDRVSDDADVVRRWALAGRGVVYKSWLDIAQDVQLGRLVVLLPELLGEPTPLNLICAHRAHLGERVRLLREHLVERCQRLIQLAPFAP
jgi:DNA-binding transcriptional LysR family regulator|tara:strand:- start:208 stop:1197 length:990 start_codon:yes stop_codon:yes gene_type:complete